MFVRQKKKISGQQPSSSSVSDSTPQPCLWRRPPSTPPLPLRAQKLVARQPSTEGLKGKGQRSGVRDSWPSALRLTCDLSPGRTQRSQTPSTVTWCVRKTPPPSSKPNPFGVPSAPPTGKSTLSLPPAANHSCYPSVPEEDPPMGRSSGATMRSLTSFCCSVFRDSLLPLDHKINQTVDLMKTHLMMMVQEEAELLRDQIAELSYRNQQLQRENIVLKAIIQNTNLTI
ncbi:hypothetical protein OJAV_G00185700 [Oryzias javanicus]|uniref:Uncharacterized protein n=1 Tax=Oryzias javanicus TaxID=123683 RepID=A0A437CFA4_ORYJA|nr:hypothetical protein OJAV_G00185700 [Oryzias javanicus]